MFSVFATGVALNLSNPKMPLFYVALLPNVVGASLTLNQIGVLTAVILAVEVVVIGGHVILASRARKLLRNARTVRRVNRAAGGVMIGPASPSLQRADEAVQSCSTFWTAFNVLGSPDRLFNFQNSSPIFASMG